RSTRERSNCSTLSTESARLATSPASAGIPIRPALFSSGSGGTTRSCSTFRGSGKNLPRLPLSPDHRRGPLLLISQPPYMPIIAETAGLPDLVFFFCLSYRVLAHKP